MSNQNQKTLLFGVIASLFAVGAVFNIAQHPSVVSADAWETSIESATVEHTTKEPSDNPKDSVTIKAKYKVPNSLDRDIAFMRVYVDGHQVKEFNIHNEQTGSGEVTVTVPNTNHGTQHSYDKYVVTSKVFEQDGFNITLKATSPNFNANHPKFQCDNTLDDDGDVIFANGGVHLSGGIDHDGGFSPAGNPLGSPVPKDPECIDEKDNSEDGLDGPCSDGIDNDNDGDTDFGNDLDCMHYEDYEESKFTPTPFMTPTPSINPTLEPSFTPSPTIDPATPLVPTP